MTKRSINDMSLKSIDVTVVGSCNIDLISYVERFPVAGETLCGSKFTMGCGGKGANQCVAAAKLGANTAMIGCLGTDTFGRMYEENFKKLNVNTEHLHFIQDVSSGVAPITVTKDGENSIVIVKGANDCLTEGHVDSAVDIITNSKMILCQLEVQPSVTLHALKLAKSKSVRTIFNPAPALKGLSPEFLAHTDILCCNETEAEILTGEKVDDMDSAINAVRALTKIGPSCVILTLGANGAMFSNTSNSNDEEVKHVTPDTKVTKNVIDTTGAGDCFVGSLAFFMARYPDMKLEDIIKRAVTIATISVGKLGTQTSYPIRDDLPGDLFL